MAGALYLWGRTPTYLAVPVLLFAVMISPYIFLRYGFLWPGLIIVTIVLMTLLYIKGYKDRGLPAFAVVLIGAGILIFIATVFGGGDLIPIETGGNGEAPSLPWDDPGTMIETTFGGSGNFLLIILVAIILIFLTIQKIIPLLDTWRSGEEEDEHIEEDISSTVDKALSDLYEGKDVESTVLRCYQKMCFILKKRGVKDTEFTTPREFEKRAIKNLKVPSSNISEIRKVFEEAKYSTHKLGDEERNRAVEALKKLRHELE